MKIRVLKEKLQDSKLFKDSFWAVFGNGLGNALMLLAGILIARFLGKDLYGEYGVVKSTMFYIASFATLGLGFTSTKYISSFVSDKKQYLKCIVRDSLLITLSFSSMIALLLLVFANMLADYLEEPSLVLAFRALALVIICKAFTTTQIGVLAGFKQFKAIAINSFVSGCFMLVICIPLTYYFSIAGALGALLSSQIFNAVINYTSIHKISKKLSDQKKKSFIKELIKFSFPVALQESSYTICHWAAIMLLTKLSSIGEVGLYSASSQWNSIITMIPVLLYNVVLSYLSGSINNQAEHNKTIKYMLIVNFVCTLVPFILVFIFSGFISSFYGESFSGMKMLLRIITFTTIFEACANVFKSEFLAQGKTWLLFTIRLIKDFVLVLGTYFALTINDGANGATCFGYVNVVCSSLFFVLCYVLYKTNFKTY